ncbi:MAG TPA: FeoC-like transcriptional regulator [Promineifilum sp.]|nr:FeoC-like transcriptional regulator [Promineifilum sp.]
MLLKVLQAVESADGPVTLTELSRRLNIAPSALEGMLGYWAGKGRLVVDGRSAAACA